MKSFTVQTWSGIDVVEFRPYALWGHAQFDELQNRLHDALWNKQSDKTVLDLSKVSMVSSAALGVFITIQRMIEVRGGLLAVCGAQKQVWQTFKLAGLDRMLDMHETRDEALDALNSKTV